MFIPLLDGVPDEFEVEISAEFARITIPIAISDDGNRLVACVCSLTPLPEENACEFSFSIVCITYDDSELPLETQDRNIAAGYIPDETRPYIIPSVCEAACDLVYHVRPETVYRVMKGRNLPEKALHKHHLITEALHTMSYVSVDNGVDEYGRAYITMQTGLLGGENG